MGAPRRWPGQQRHFGSKQPAKVDQLAQLKSLISGCRRLDALPDHRSLANMYRQDPKLVECLIGAERRRRMEAGTE